MVIRGELGRLTDNVNNDDQFGAGDVVFDCNARVHPATVNGGIHHSESHPRIIQPVDTVYNNLRTPSSDLPNLFFFFNLNIITNINISLHSYLNKTH